MDPLESPPSITLHSEDSEVMLIYPTRIILIAFNMYLLDFTATKIVEASFSNFCTGCS